MSYKKIKNTVKEFPGTTMFIFGLSLLLSLVWFSAYFKVHPINNQYIEWIIITICTYVILLFFWLLVICDDSVTVKATEHSHKFLTGIWALIVGGIWMFRLLFDYLLINYCLDASYESYWTSTFVWWVKPLVFTIAIFYAMFAVVVVFFAIAKEVESE